MTCDIKEIPIGMLCHYKKWDYVSLYLTKCSLRNNLRLKFCRYFYKYYRFSNTLDILQNICLLTKIRTEMQCNVIRSYLLTWHLYVVHSPIVSPFNISSGLLQSIGWQDRSGPNHLAVPLKKKHWAPWNPSILL